MLILREDALILDGLVLEVDGLVPLLQFRVVELHVVEEFSQVGHFCLVVIQTAEAGQFIVVAAPRKIVREADDSTKQTC